jgi:hypothetical protein
MLYSELQCMLRIFRIPVMQKQLELDPAEKFIWDLCPSCAGMEINLSSG